MLLKQRYIRQRRYALVRTVATLTGDFAVGMAFGSLCSWIISAAALGTFLSFLAWIVAALLALLVSQHLVHPGVKFLLSDRKLDDVVDGVQALLQAAVPLAQRVSAPDAVWQAVRRGAQDLRDRLRPA